MTTFFDGVQDMGAGLVLGELAENCKPVVIGIDFGTAYSGIAFAYKADPGAIQCGAPTATDATQMKVPTVLLQHEDGSWDFGYTAEKRYNDILMDHTHGSPLPAHLFKRFKMVLKGEVKGFDTLVARSLDGKPHSLLDLVTRALRFLKVRGGEGHQRVRGCSQSITRCPVGTHCARDLERVRQGFHAQGGLQSWLDGG